MKITYYYLIFIFFVFGLTSEAQNTTKEKDSAAVYKKIELLSKKSKFTKAIHKLVFRSTNKQKTKRRTKRSVQNYNIFQGLPIRNVIIETLDPFGQSVYDSSKQPKNWLGRIGNKAHIKSKSLAIKNLLLFKAGDALDTLSINESKRLMRSQNFIRSVKIDAIYANIQKDSVDVKVRVLDSWSLIPKGSISTSRLNVTIEERNFFGLGHELNNTFTRKYNESQNAHSLSYIVPTIKDTYIMSAFNYNETLDGDGSRKVSIGRDFISPFTLMNNSHKIRFQTVRVCMNFKDSNSKLKIFGLAWHLNC